MIFKIIRMMIAICIITNNNHADRKNFDGNNTRLTIILISSRLMMIIFSLVIRLMQIVEKSYQQ